MVEPQMYSGEERRLRDRSRGIVLRRRSNVLPEGQVERRRAPVHNGFDIASALEMHLDEHKGRRAMLNLLESWLSESKSAQGDGHDDGYQQAVEYAIEVMKGSPDVLTAIAVLQRKPEES
ncbi:MAG TPA: hypothetical protein VHP37_13040 [Burkholderiales bacterium]|nr:hypothetical protein [Burkholderiales bacterium]